MIVVILLARHHHFEVVCTLEMARVSVYTPTAIPTISIGATAFLFVAVARRRGSGGLGGGGGSRGGGAPGTHSSRGAGLWGRVRQNRVGVVLAQLIGIGLRLAEGQRWGYG